MLKQDSKDSSSDFIIDMQIEEKTTGDHVLDFFKGMQDTSGIRNEMRFYTQRKSWNQFWSKFRMRIWNFFVEACIIPSNRPEWEKYNYWYYRSPLRPVPTGIAEKQKSKRLKRRKKLLRQMKTIGSPGILHNSRDCTRVKINISGQIFETQLRTLKQFPDTLLGDPTRRLPYFDPKRDEYFFERNRLSFPAILYWYQSGGQLNCPESVPLDIFEDELKFFEIPDYIINELRVRNPTSEIDDKQVLPKNLLQRKIWLLMEYPESSIQARLVAIISIFTILLAITMFCLETLPIFSATHHGIDLDYITYVDVHDPFSISETSCVIWFVFEILVRFLSCPDKLKFLIHLENVVDVIAIIPYFIQIEEYFTSHQEHRDPKRAITDIRGDSTLTFFKVIRLVRIFRIFKLSRYSKGLRILGQTLKASIGELSLLCFFLIIGVVLFSSAMYYAEIHEEEQRYESILHAFWWAIVTMTTIGYGDMMPVGVMGKVINALCAIAGVIVVALPVPVIVQNFNYYYNDQVETKRIGNEIHTAQCPFRPTCGKNHIYLDSLLKTATKQNLDNPITLFWKNKKANDIDSIIPKPAKNTERKYHLFDSTYSKLKRNFSTTTTIQS